jgi:aryl-alcohol dehydrogenase-like predicted oxidoreductase
MEFRTLGRSGLKVPGLSFGHATFGGGTEFFRAWGVITARFGIEVPFPPRPPGGTHAKERQRETPGTQNRAISTAASYILEEELVHHAVEGQTSS